MASCYGYGPDKVSVLVYYKSLPTRPSGVEIAGNRSFSSCLLQVIANGLIMLNIIYYQSFSSCLLQVIANFISRSALQRRLSSFSSCLLQVIANKIQKQIKPLRLSFSSCLLQVIANKDSKTPNPKDPKVSVLVYYKSLPTLLRDIQHHVKVKVSVLVYYKSLPTGIVPMLSEYLKEFQFLFTTSHCQLI